MTGDHLVSSLLLILYTFIYVVFYLKLRRKRAYFGPTSLTLLVYGILGVCSIIVYIDKDLSNLYEGYGKLTFFPFLYLITIVLLVLKPTVRLEKYYDLKIQKPSNNLVVYFLIFYAVCSLAIFPNTLSRIQDGLQILFFSADGGQNLYTEGQLDDGRNFFKYIGVQSILSVFHDSLNEISILLMFYYLTFKKKHTGLIILLSIAFVADLLKPIASGQRTGFVLTMLSIVLCYLIFRRYWDTKLQQVASKILIVLVVIVSIPFIALTISRFSLSQEGTTGSTLSYLGQANLNFNLYCLDAGGTRHGDRVVRGFKSVLGMETTNSTRDTREKYSNMKIDDRVFYTYVGDFVLDFGLILATFILLAYALIVNSVTLLRGHTIKFHQLLVLYFSLAISLKGSFYLFPYAYSGNQIIAAFFLMYIVFKFDCMNQSFRHSYLTINN